MAIFIDVAIKYFDTEQLPWAEFDSFRHQVTTYYSTGNTLEQSPLDEANICSSSQEFPPHL
jgi:hypothetical protein